MIFAIFIVPTFNKWKLFEVVVHARLAKWFLWFSFLRKRLRIGSILLWHLLLLGVCSTLIVFFVDLIIIKLIKGLDSWKKGWERRGKWRAFICKLICPLVVMVTTHRIVRISIEILYIIITQWNYKPHYLCTVDRRLEDARAFESRQLQGFHCTILHCSHLMNQPTWSQRNAWFLPAKAGKRQRAVLFSLSIWKVDIILWLTSGILWNNSSCVRVSIDIA
jgi:hypothetical protein